MRSPSPPTERVVRIVALLIDAAPNALSLAEIVRLTGLSRSTAHAIVTELTGQQWIRRDSATGEFGIGPGFVAIAHATTRSDHLTAWADEPMRNLAQHLGMGCFLARRTDDSAIVVVDHRWPTPTPPAAHPWMEAGRRIPLQPPICREFIAWSSPADREEWLAAAPPAARTRLRLVLEAVADRGYSIERATDDHSAILDALSSLHTLPSGLRARVGDLLSEISTVDYLPTELVGEVSAVTVGAPIFGAPAVGTPAVGARSTVIASIVACPNAAMTPQDLLAIGGATRAAADEVSARIRHTGKSA